MGVHAKGSGLIAGLVVLVATSACNGPAELQPPTDHELLASAVDFYTASRNEKGIYRDKLRFDGLNGAPSSIAATGMGLISLCLGSRLGLNASAAQDAKTTVRTMLEFEHARNATGFYNHFIDMETGERVWNSEYSTIDTAILVSGALFAASCLPGDHELDSLVSQLWRSVQWTEAVADPETGAIYLEMLEDGSGKPGSFIRPFNEYMLVAWFAQLAEQTGSGPAAELWQRFYANADSLPTSDYAGYAVLTDQPGAFLSSFVIQFAYYLCHPFTTGDRYQAFMRNAALADRAWWEEATGARDYQWGLGAGSAPSVGYRADAINNDPDQIVSPHIVAGFFPVDSTVIRDLDMHFVDVTGAVRAMDGVRGSLLWRYSVASPQWAPEDIQGIDYSTMMLGLATSVLGSSFIAEHNDVEAWLALN